jgi:hypothetical protein
MALVSSSRSRDFIFLSEPPCCRSEIMHYFNDACGSVQLETRGLALAEAQYLPLKWRNMSQDSCLKLKTKKKYFFVLTSTLLLWFRDDGRRVL